VTQGAWDPEQYERFGVQRTQPFYDLLALVRSRPGMRVVDLGCGTGGLTQVLHRRFAAAETMGIDNSPAMLAKSGAFVEEGLRFERADIRDLAPDHRYDLIFSNAALQWVPNHKELLYRLTASLAANGQLAVQVPANDDHPSHVVAAEVAGEEPFREVLGGYTRRNHVLEPEGYAILLDRLGFRDQHVRLQVYGHRLGSREEVVEWVKGSLLTDYRGRMPAEPYQRFLDRYRERLIPQLEDTRPYFYPFKRILMWAQR